MKRLRAMKMLSSTAIFLIVSSIAFPFLAPSAMAQATTGGIGGVVTDEKNAVIPDAEVTLRNTATGSETKIKTNSEGLYKFASVPGGTYVLTIEKQGFKKGEFTGVIVTIGQVTTIDATLQTGLASETVTVTAGEGLIQKEQTQISNSFEARKVADLPSNGAGNGIDTLALLAPGVVPGFGNVNSNGTTLSVNGNRARSNNFTIDGGDNNDLSIGGPNYFVDNNDIVSEFQVITNNFSAEYGRNQGAIVNIVTKAGTNEYHGTLYWAHRDHKLFDALSPIEKRGGSTEPSPDLYNVFSGTIGGKIIKDRLFFFGSYQYISDRQTFVGLGTTPAIAASDLPKLETIAGFSTNPVLQAIRNLSAFAINNFGTLSERTDFPQNNTITIGGVTMRTAFPRREFPVPFDQHEFSVRGDYKISDNHSMWFRQLYQKSPEKNSLADTSGNTGDIPFSSKISSGQLTSQLSGNAVNEFRFIYNSLDVIFGGGCEGQTACIPNPFQMGDTITNLVFTGTRDSGGNNLRTIGPATNLPQGRTVSVYQFSDNFSKTFGRHQIKTGADIRRLTNTVPFLPNVNGAYQFRTAQSIVDNRPQQVVLAAGQVVIAYNETDQFYYVNDDWRIKDNLTLNLGVRYEYIGQPINTLNELSVKRESDPNQAIWRQSLPLEQRTYAKLPADKNNFAPRIGFAYRPRFDNKFAKFLFGEQDATVIRGGYSVAYDPPFYNLMLNISTSSPLVFNNTTLNPASGAVVFPLVSPPNGATIQQFASDHQIVAKNLFDPRFFNQTQVSHNFYNPYAQQFSFGLQREVSKNNVLEARWVATKGTGLFQTLNRNPRVDHLINGFTASVPGLGSVTFPGFPNLVPTGVSPTQIGQGGCVDNPATTTLNEANTCVNRMLPQALIRSRENTANSIYHSLQTRYQSRIFNQLNLGVSYTFSKALDNASEVFSFQESAASQDPFNSNKLEKALSGFDRRHALSMNWIWDVPFFKTQSGFLGRALGGWQVNGVLIAASGLRFTPSQFGNVAFLGAARSYDDTTWAGSFIGTNDNVRPFIGNPNAPAGSVGISQIDAALMFGIPVVDKNGFWTFASVNTADTPVAGKKEDFRFIFNGPGAAMLFGTPFGNATRNSLKGPKLNNLNLGLYKNTKIRERYTLRFQFDMFNAFNHNQPGYGFFGTTTPIPDRFIEDAGLTDGFNDFGGINGSSRVLQFGLKIIF